MMKDLKSSARKAALAAREAAHATAHSGAKTANKTAPANRHLLAAIGPARGRIIAGFLPIRTEIDPLPAMAALHASGARICVPVMAGAGQPLDFREWTPDCPLIEGPFGVKIPAQGDWLVPDTLIVPLVAFDVHLNRLGYGGGFYDRSLERLRKAAPTRAIGFAYGAQELPLIPQEPTDQPLDALVTENGLTESGPTENAPLAAPDAAP